MTVPEHYLIVSGIFAAFLFIGPLSAICEEAAAGRNGTGFAGAYAPSKYWQPPTDPQALAKLKKFQDLKFGFFCCWGTQTQWGTVDQSWCLCPEQYEWNKKPAEHAGEDVLTFKKSYEALARTFNPVKFDPQAIAELAEAAGTRYLVFCTKHHDGFCFWDTKVTDYKITSKDCPYHANPNADVTKALFEAFRKKGFWIGAYFSKADWNVPYYWAPEFGPPTSRNPNYTPGRHPEVWKKFKDFTWSQLRELVSGYGSVDILWLDGGQVQPGNGQDIDMPGIARMARELQPGLLMVDRCAGGGNEDFLTPEGVHEMPRSFRPEVWEACMTLGDRWGWTRNSSYHSSGAIIRYLVKAVARNGNLLLDVGPDANGELDPKAVSVLREVGAWLKINGEAIYETRPLEPYEADDCFFTRKADGTAYAIVLSRKDGETMPESVVLPASIVGEGASVVMVGGNGSALDLVRGSNRTVSVRLPNEAPCSAAWTIRIKTRNSGAKKKDVIAVETSGHTA